MFLSASGWASLLADGGPRTLCWVDDACCYARLNKFLEDFRLGMGVFASSASCDACCNRLKADFWLGMPSALFFASSVSGSFWFLPYVGRLFLKLGLGEGFSSLWRCFFSSNFCLALAMPRFACFRLVEIIFERCKFSSAMSARGSSLPFLVFEAENIGVFTDDFFMTNSFSLWFESLKKLFTYLSPIGRSTSFCTLSSVEVLF